MLLSLKLSRLVEGLTSSALVQGACLPACVTSQEDHGYLLSFGIQVLLAIVAHAIADPVVGQGADSELSV